MRERTGGLAARGGGSGTGGVATGEAMAGGDVRGGAKAAAVERERDRGRYRRPIDLSDETLLRWNCTGV